MPSGTTENQKIWNKLVCQVFYYAIPDEITSNLIEQFIDNYGNNSEAYPALAKISHEYYGKIHDRNLMLELRKIEEKLADCVANIRITKEDYELVKGYYLSLIDPNQETFFLQDFIESLMENAIGFGDREFAFQL